MSGKRTVGFGGVWEAAKDDLKALRDFPSSEDAVWRVLFSTPVISVALLIFVLGCLAFLQLAANLIGWVTR